MTEFINIREEIARRLAEAEPEFRIVERERIAEVEQFMRNDPLIRNGRIFFRGD